MHYTQKTGHTIYNTVKGYQNYAYTSAGKNIRNDQFSSQTQKIPNWFLFVCVCVGTVRSPAPSVLNMLLQKFEMFKIFAMTCLSTNYSFKILINEIPIFFSETILSKVTVVTSYF